MDLFIQRFQDRRVAGKYSLVRKLGEGGFSAVYLGNDFDLDEEVALKLEHCSQQPSILSQEAEVYKSFHDLVGFPAMYWYGQLDDYNVMAFELLGPNLEDLFAFCGNRFTLKTTLALADQLLQRFESLHTKGFLHRDVKPQNCLLGLGASGNVVYITDFGLAQEYRPPADGDEEHAVKDDSRLVGTTRYASLRGHSGQAQSPRDDLESLGYMLIYFLRGKLPWQGLRASAKEEKDRMVMEAKSRTSVNHLCDGLRPEFAKYMEYVKSLKQGQTPDYTMLRELFDQVARSQGIEYDNVFDWTVRLYLQQIG